jgi:hypothetical protein
LAKKLVTCFRLAHLDPLLERGDLPNLQALIDRGQKDVLLSAVPTTRGGMAVVPDRSARRTASDREGRRAPA